MIEADHLYDHALGRGHGRDPAHHPAQAQVGPTLAYVTLLGLVGSITAVICLLIVPEYVIASMFFAIVEEYLIDFWIIKVIFKSLDHRLTIQVF